MKRKEAHHESDCTIDCWTGVRTLPQLNQMLDRAYADFDKAESAGMRAHERRLIESIEAGIDAREKQMGASHED